MDNRRSKSSVVGDTFDAAAKDAANRQPFQGQPTPEQERNAATLVASAW